MTEILTANCIFEQHQYRLLEFTLTKIAFFVVVRNHYGICNVLFTATALKIWIDKLKTNSNYYS